MHNMKNILYLCNVFTNDNDKLKENYKFLKYNHYEETTISICLSCM